MILVSELIVVIALYEPDHFLNLNMRFVMEDDTVTQNILKLGSELRKIRH